MDFSGSCVKSSSSCLKWTEFWRGLGFRDRKLLLFLKITFISLRKFILVTFVWKFISDNWFSYRIDQLRHLQIEISPTILVHQKELLIKKLALQFSRRLICRIFFFAVGHTTCLLIYARRIHRFFGATVVIWAKGGCGASFTQSCSNIPPLGLESFSLIFISFFTFSVVSFFCSKEYLLLLDPVTVNRDKTKKSNFSLVFSLEWGKQAWHLDFGFIRLMLNLWDITWRGKCWGKSSKLTP